MRHSTTPPRPSPPSPGTTIRDMRIDDCEAVATIRVRGWQHAYRGLLPQPYLDRMDIAEETGQRRRYFEERGEAVNVVAERPDGTVTGWACVGPHRAEDHGLPGCELYAIYVLPEHIGTGTGRALLAERRTGPPTRVTRTWRCGCSGTTARRAGSTSGPGSGRTGARTRSWRAGPW